VKEEVQIQSNQLKGHLHTGSQKATLIETKRHWNMEEKSEKRLRRRSKVCLQGHKQKGGEGEEGGGRGGNQLKGAQKKPPETKLGAGE